MGVVIWNCLISMTSHEAMNISGIPKGDNTIMRSMSKGWLRIMDCSKAAQVNRFFLKGMITTGVLGNKLSIDGIPKS
jgi:hypothetical protein